MIIISIIRLFDMFERLILSWTLAECFSSQVRLMELRSCSRAEIHSSSEDTKHSIINEVLFHVCAFWCWDFPSIVILMCNKDKCGIKMNNHFRGSFMYNLTVFDCFTKTFEENDLYISRKTLYVILSLYDTMCNSGKCNYPKIFLDLVCCKITGSDVWLDCIL